MPRISDDTIKNQPRPAPNLHNQIVELLTSLPNIQDKNERRALIYSATLDKELENQIEFEGSTTRFCHVLVKTLGLYGHLDDNRNPLEAVLEAAKQQIGQDKQAECERLIATLKNLPEDEQQQFQRSLKSPRNIPLLLQYALIGLIAVVIGAGGLWYYLSTTQPFAFTIYVRDSQGDIVLQNAGSVILELGSLPQEREIGEYGEAYFEQIYPKFRNQPITLKLKAEGSAL